MYPVSQTWRTLMAQGNHVFQTKVVIAGTTVPESRILGLSTSFRMFSGNQPSVGGCLSAELTLSLLAPDFSIPRMAPVEPFVRVTDGVQTSEWIPQGKFYIDTRETTANDDGLPILTIHGYDALLKAEGDFPDTTVSFPQTDVAVVGLIASELGVGIDSRTTDLMVNGYEIGLPVGYSMREVLENIAAMYAGNWLMSYDGELLLVAINGCPPETNYLVDAVGEPITFGGDRILV